MTSSRCAPLQGFRVTVSTLLRSVYKMRNKPDVLERMSTQDRARGRSKWLRVYSRGRRKSNRMSGAARHGLEREGGRTMNRAAMWFSAAFWLVMMGASRPRARSCRKVRCRRPAGLRRGGQGSPGAGGPHDGGLERRRARRHERDGDHARARRLVLHPQHDRRQRASIRSSRRASTRGWRSRWTRRTSWTRSFSR